MRIYYITIVLILATTLAHARKRGDYYGCISPDYCKEFQLDRVLGAWHLFASYDHDFERGCDCMTLYLEAIGNDTMKLTNCCQKRGISYEKQVCGFGVTEATLVNPGSKLANFSYKRYGSPNQYHGWIIDTDYDNYYIAAGCECDHQVVWVITRKAIISKRLYNKLKRIVKNHGLNTRRMLKRRQGSDVCKSRRHLHTKHFYSN